MAIVLTYATPHDLSQLLDEVYAAVPALAPVPGPTGVPTSVVQAESDGTTVRLTVPDGTDTTAVDAVVVAHVPQTVYDPTERARDQAAVRRRERVRGDYQEARALVAAATTVEELRDATLAALDRLQR